MAQLGGQTLHAAVSQVDIPRESFLEFDVAAFLLSTLEGRL
jgi:hypothetical protein